MINKYQDLKLMYKDSVILIKNGMFYITFSDDAHVLNYLFSY